MLCKIRRHWQNSDVPDFGRHSSEGRRRRACSALPYYPGPPACPVPVVKSAVMKDLAKSDAQEKRPFMSNDTSSGALIEGIEVCLRSGTDPSD